MTLELLGGVTPSAIRVLKLHATAAPYLARSKPDKVVLHLLAAPD